MPARLLLEPMRRLQATLMLADGGPKTNGSANGASVAPPADGGELPPRRVPRTLLFLSGEAGDGRTALEQAKELRPDIVVMDISMPELTGTAATERLRAAAPDIKVLALTVHEDKSYLRQLLQAGASGYILKRAAATELVQAARARLSDSERSMSELRTEGLSWHDVAERLGERADAVRNRLNRALKRVVRELGLEELDGD